MRISPALPTDPILFLEKPMRTFQGETYTQLTYRDLDPPFTDQYHPRSTNQKE